jgi:hypothetical protein
MSEADERAKRAMTMPGGEAQRRLSGDELEAAIKAARWVDPGESAVRIEMGLLATGRYRPMWVPHTTVAIKLPAYSDDARKAAASRRVGVAKAAQMKRDARAA